MDRPYVDISGAFHEGAEGRRKKIAIDAANAYAAEGKYDDAADVVALRSPEHSSMYRERADRAYGKDLAGKVVGNDWKGASAIAAERGDLQNLTTLKKFESEEIAKAHDTMGRYANMITVIGSMAPEEQQNAYAAVLKTARSEAAEAGQDASYLDALPTSYSPLAAKSLVARLMNAADFYARELQERKYVLDERKTDVQERRADAAETTAQAALARAGASDDRAARADENRIRGGETSLRKEFDGVTKDFRAVRDSYAQIKKLATAGTAGSDLSFIFSFMKMLDPGSVVREGEFANAQNASGVPGQVVNLYNQALKGTRLNPNQRADFLARSKDIYDARLDQYNRDAETFKDYARGYGYNPDNVVRDQTLPDEPAGGDSDDDFIIDPKSGKAVPNPAKAGP